MIFTLDDKLWQEEELVEKMYEDSFYYGYMGENSLSSSSIKLLSKNPLKYLEDKEQDQKKPNPAFDFGSLFHWYVLEPHVYKEQIFVEGNRRTKEYKEALSEHGRVFLQKDKDKVEEIAETFLSCSKIHDILEKSRPEVPAVGYIDGLLFRAKADILGDGYIADLKTCANLKWFKSDAWKFGYSAQVYIYTKLFDIDYTNWVFIAVDKETGEFGFFTVSEEFYLKGKEIVHRGIENYKRIQQGDVDFEPYYIEGVI